MAVMKVRLGWLFTDMKAEVVNVSARRRKAFIPVLGREGDLQQDLGSTTRRITIRGSLYNAGGQFPTTIPALAASTQEALQGFLTIAIENPNVHPIVIFQYLELMWRLKWLMPFISDIAITLVAIDDIQWAQNSTAPNVYHYQIQLSEYIASPVAIRSALSMAAANIEQNIWSE